jgi:hypothetical protein
MLFRIGMLFGPFVCFSDKLNIVIDNIFNNFNLA